MKTTPLIAKLLANENINVIQQNVDTAAFDLINRTLILPNWQDASAAVETMLIAHEVSHALYTPVEYVDEVKADTRMSTYYNVIEDVRIERLIKKRYPGIRKDMAEGYRELVEKDMFGLADVQDLNTLFLIDRINIYYKAGAISGVPFVNQKEIEFRDRAYEVETFEEVIELAKEIYAYSDEHEEHKKQPPQEDQEQQEQEEAGRTQRAADEFLGNMIDDSINVYWKLGDTLSVDRIVPYKRIIDDLKSSIPYERSFHSNAPKIVSESYLKDHEDAKRILKSSVSYLQKEFEMRKSAGLLKRAIQSKSGSLDMGKLWSYKTNDDLFKRVTSLPKGKNHGMIFLLDWSGSMSNVIDQTVNQVVALADFCRRTDIPFVVYAFTNQRPVNLTYINLLPKVMYFKQNLGNGVINTFSGGNFLMELLSSRMNKTDYNEMLKYILVEKEAAAIRDYPGYDLGSTPLFESLYYCMEKVIPEFQSSTKVEKLTFVVLADGETDSISTVGDADMDFMRQKYDNSTKKYTLTKVRNYVKDHKTNLTHEIQCEYNYSHYRHDACNVILKMIKSRYDITIVGFFLTQNRTYPILDAMATVNPTVQVDESFLIPVRQQFKSKGYALIPAPGYDEMYLIPSTKTQDFDEMNFDASASALKISKQLTKQFASKVGSKYLLSKFIDLVA